MSTSTSRCVCKLFRVITVPIRALLMNVFLLVLIELVKFCVVLLLTFSLGYLFFNFWSTGSENRPLGNAAGSRLSAGLIQNGSFSRFPYVIEMPTKTSAESVKTKQNQRV